MTIPFELMTIEALERAYAFWDFKVRQASSWGSTMEQAEANRLEAEKWLTIRRSERQ